MILEEFQRYTKGVPTHIVTSVLNMHTRGTNWTGCSKKMICEDLFRYHAPAAETINAERFAENIKIAMKEFAVGKEINKKRAMEIDQRIAADRKLHAIVGDVLRKIPNLQPLLATEREALTTFIRRHLPGEFKE